MSKAYRVLIVGSGDMGRNHVAAWKRRGDGEIVAVCDPDFKRAQALADAGGTQAFADYTVAITKLKPDIVSICVPVHLHRAVAEFALQNGCHVHVEKPIAGTIQDARAIQQAARAAGRKVVVSYQYRGFFGYARLKELLGTRLPAERLFMHCLDIREVRPKLAMHHKSMNGGPVIDMAGHFFDMGRYLFNAEPVSVFARGHIQGANRPRLATVTDFAIDAAQILVDYENGHTLSAHVNWGMPENFPEFSSVQIVGSTFHATVSQKSVVVVQADQRLAWETNDSIFGPDCRVADLVYSIENDTTPIVDAETGIRALAVCLGALQSIESGRVVMIDDILRSA